MKSTNKKYVAAFFAVLLSLTLAAIFVFQRHPPAPEQARSPHEMAHRAKGIAEEATHDTSQASAYYQAESTRRMAERLTPILHHKAKTTTNLISSTEGKSGFDFYMCKIKS